MSGAGLAARSAALSLLGGVLNGRRMLPDLIADGVCDALPPPERARAQGLATGVLRHMGRIDALLAAFMDKPPAASVQDVLRLVAFEVLVDGTAPHGAVDAAVRLVQASPGTRHLSGLTNAVARRITAEGPGLWPDLPPGDLPTWLARPIRKAYGAAALAAITAAHSQNPPLDLTLRDPATAQAMAAALDAGILPTGSLRLRRAGQVSALPGYAEGAWWVQDAAAAMPVRLLGDVSGLTVLDLCAAPGGKTLQLAAGGARVTALDLSPTRLARVEENLARTGLAAGIVAADARAWTPPEDYDAILLDAPCSATGTLRRHPDLTHARPSPDLRPLLALQAELIDRALGWLKPGGRLLYCTCSLLPKEGEGQVAAALARHPGLVTLVPPVAGGLDPGWLSATGALRLRPDFWPDRGGMDGFFATVFQIP